MPPKHEVVYPTISGFTVVGQPLGSNVMGLGHGFGIAIALHKEDTDDGSFPVLVLAWVSLSHKITCLIKLVRFQTRQALVAWSGGEEEGVSCWLCSAVERDAYQTATQMHQNYIQNKAKLSLPWHFPQNSCTGMMMWKRLWMLCCLRAETLPGLKGKWGIHQEGTGDDLWVNATQTHISASLGKASAP